MITEETKQKILRLAEEGYTAREIAGELNVRLWTVEYIARGKLHGRRGGVLIPVTEEVKEEIRRLVETGMSAQRISEVVGCSYMTVRRTAYGRIKGVRDLSTDDVDEVRRRAESGESIAQIAAGMGISAFAVQRIGRGLFRNTGGGRNAISEEKKSEIRRLFLEGKNVREIAEDVAVSPGFVLRYTADTGLRKPRWRAEKWRGITVIPAPRPALRLRFLRDDGLPDLEAQRNYEELWIVKERALRRMQR